MFKHSEAKSSPNLVSQGEGVWRVLNNLVSFGLTYFCYGPLDHAQNAACE
jgi:hypothetical protein